MTGVVVKDAIWKCARVVMPEEFADFFIDREKDIESANDLRTGSEKEITIITDNKKRHYLCHAIGIEGGLSEQQGRVLLVSFRCCGSERLGFLFQCLTLCRKDSLQGRPGSRFLPVRR